MSRQATSAISPSGDTAATPFLQRKCDCGKQTGAFAGDCEECRSGKLLGVQTKLSIGASDDPLEHEADRAAARVLSMQSAEPATTGAQRPVVSRRHSVGGAAGQSEVPQSVVQTLRSSGEPLTDSTREFFEPRFAHNFGNVRVHRDSASADDVNALAYTVGNHIVFAAGRYSTQTSAGRELLAHELAHTIQQSGDSQPQTLSRRGGTIGGFFNDIGRGIADFFTGSEPDYSDEVLLEYLRVIDRSGEIEDDFDSDNKARAVVERWRSGNSDGGPNRDFLLTMRLKILLINEMLSGFTGNPDENAILYLLSDSPDTELSPILREVGIDRLNDAFQGAQQDQLDALVARHERRRAGGDATSESTDRRLANVEGSGIDRELTEYLQFIDIRDRARRAPDSHRHAREVVRRWASGDERYFLPVRRKQLLIRELLSGDDSSDDREAVLQLLRGFNNVRNDVDIRMIGQEPGETWIRSRMDPPQGDEFDQIMQASADRESASDALRTDDDWIERVVVDQEIPQTVTAHWHSGATDSDICSTGKGHCCVDENDAQGAACSESESTQSGSNCTSMGTRKVVKKFEHPSTLPDYWCEFHDDRDIALHEYSRVDGTPLSHGCVRLRRPMAQKIFAGVVKFRTDVEVKGLARPRCNWPALQAEWAGDFAKGNSEVDDGEPIDEQRREQRRINRQRGTTRETHDVDNAGLDAMLERLDQETGGLRPAYDLFRGRSRSAAFRSIAPVVDEIPRCVATQTVEESRLDTHSEPGAIIGASGFDHFATDFERDLQRSHNFRRAEERVREHATELWRESVSRAQQSNANTDDRPLYWARLQMTRALRQWQPSWHRTHPGRAKIGTIDDIRRDKARLLAIFEQVSRGMADVAFDTESDAKRILISGFDPFGLQNHIDRGNPSGAAVLALDNKLISNAAGTEAQVQGVIFPVRFADFDQGVVEQFFSPFINSDNPPDMIMTISQGGRDFEVEQFAGRLRSSGRFADNAGVTSGGTLDSPVEAPGLEQGPQFTETTLPADAIRSSLGRSTATPGETRIMEIRQGETRPVNADSPSAGSTAVRGAGGGFLSNEIFYRTSLLRDRAGSSIPLGHLHTPALPPESRVSDFAQQRDAIVTQIESILEATIDEI